MITVEQLARELGGEFLAGEAAKDREITGGYAGDLLSWVMGRAKEGDAWLTVMSNVNTIAVAVLADVACIVLCEGAALEPDARTRAGEQKVPVIGTALPVYEAAVRLGALL